MPDLYLKSCEIMTELGDSSVDLIVTSPPYWVDPSDTYHLPAAPLTATSGVFDKFCNIIVNDQASESRLANGAFRHSA